MGNLMDEKVGQVSLLDASPDPTANVIALNETAVRRIDDLRVAETRRIDDLRVAETRRVDQLGAAESRRADEQARLRADYDEKLRDAEAKRIDAIRAVDVNAVAVASARAADQATVLANQVVSSAEALRTLVASTAATVAASQAQLATTLSTRLTTLEQAQYQSQGKQAVTDPAMASLAGDVKQFMAAQTLTTGKSAGVGLVFAAAVAIFSVLISLGALIYTVTRAPVAIEQVPVATSTIVK